MEKRISEYFLVIKILEHLFFSITIGIALSLAISLLFCLMIQTSLALEDTGNIFKISNTKMIQDQYNYKHLVGILKNDANKTVNDVIITANFSDKTNRSIGNFSKQSEITTINPKGISPFDILIYNKDINDKINKFLITIKFDFTNHKDEDLAIESSSSHIDMLSGFYFINGEIKNKGQLYSNNTTIVSITYDKNKDIAGIWKAQTEPYNIPPFTNASFSIPVTDKTQSYNILNYTLLAESDEYLKSK